MCRHRHIHTGMCTHRHLPYGVCTPVHRTCGRRWGSEHGVRWAPPRLLSTPIIQSCPWPQCAGPGEAEGGKPGARRTPPSPLGPVAGARGGSMGNGNRSLSLRGACSGVCAAPWGAASRPFPTRCSALRGGTSLRLWGCGGTSIPAPGGCHLPPACSHLLLAGGVGRPCGCL